MSRDKSMIRKDWTQPHNAAEHASVSVQNLIIRNREVKMRRCLDSIVYDTRCPVIRFKLRGILYLACVCLFQ